MLNAAESDAIRACKRRDGSLDPADVVEAARSPKNPLHGRFDWDIRSAAQKHWLDVAGQLIREVRFRVVVEERPAYVVEFVRNPAAPPGLASRISLTNVEKGSDQAKEICRAEIQRIISCVDRARSIAAVLGLQHDFEDILRRAILLRQKVDNTRPPPPKGGRKK